MGALAFRVHAYGSRISPQVYAVLWKLVMRVSLGVYKGTARGLAAGEHSGAVQSQEIGPNLGP